MNIKTITPPGEEPVTVAEVKTYAHISHAAEDALIGSLILSGRVLCEGYQNRAYITQTLEVSYDGFPRTPFCLPRAPLQSVTSITYYDTDDAPVVVPASAYQVDTSGEPGRINLGYGQIWPTVVLRDINAVVVRYIAGFGDAAATLVTNPNIHDAILLYCTYRLENRAGEIDLPAQVKGLLRHDRIIY